MTDYKDQFVGAWELLDWKVTHLETGAVTEYFGGRAKGYIMYTPDGWVSSSIHDTGRPRNSDDRTARNELVAAIEADGCADLTSDQYELLTPYALSALGYLGYCGPYTADAECVHHTVLSAGRPSHVGIVLTRTYQFEGDELRLIAQAFGYEDNLLWRRANAAKASR